MEIFGIPIQAMMGQLLIGLINGSFYALLSLGLAVIFGLLNIINFTPGAQYMLGAFGAYLLGFTRRRFLVANFVGVLLACIAIAAVCVLIERGVVADDSLAGRLLIKRNVVGHE